MDDDFVAGAFESLQNARIEMSLDTLTKWLSISTMSFLQLLNAERKALIVYLRTNLCSRYFGLNWMSFFCLFGLPFTLCLKINWNRWNMIFTVLLAAACFLLLGCRWLLHFVALVFSGSLTRMISRCFDGDVQFADWFFLLNHLIQHVFGAVLRCGFEIAFVDVIGNLLLSMRIWRSFYFRTSTRDSDLCDCCRSCVVFSWSWLVMDPTVNSRFVLCHVCRPFWLGSRYVLTENSQLGHLFL